jgi:hypothetical protein
MIPGRFKTSYSSYSPIQIEVVIRIVAWFNFLPLRIRQSFLGRYIESNAYIHLLDTFIKTREVDPFDDSRLRYVVRIYKFDEKRKQVVPTRAAASTTLRGAQKLAKQFSDNTSLPFTQNEGLLKEYITIYCYRAYVDYEKARARSWGRR